MKSRVNVMMSLVPFWLPLVLLNPIVYSRPETYGSTKLMAGENHLEKQHNKLTTADSQDMFKDLLLGEFKRALASATPSGIPANIGRTGHLNQSGNSRAAKTLSEFFPAYSDPKLIYKEFVYHKRRKRELRWPRKIDSSPPSIAVPAYYPFIMAEMIPGTVKTRHPSIIAVNGCPAYFIADHTGRCRQVFQYTVQFGQRSPIPKAPPHLPRRTLFTNLRSQSESLKLSESESTAPEEQSVPSNTQINTPSPLHPHPHLRFRPGPSTGPNPRLLSLLRNAAKKFNLSLLNNHNSSASSSGEVVTEDNIKKLRQKILSALKITNNYPPSKDESKKSDKKKEDLKSNSDDDD